MSDSNKLIFGIISLFVVMVLVAGCGKVPTTGTGPGTTTPGSYSEVSFNPKLAISSQSFGSAAELNSFLQGHSSTGYNVRYGGMMYATAGPTAGGMMEKAVASDSSGAGSAPALWERAGGKHRGDQRAGRPGEGAHGGHRGAGANGAGPRAIGPCSGRHADAGPRHTRPA